MADDDTRGRIAHARNAAILSKIGSLSGALGVVVLALGVVGLLTDRAILGVIAVVIAVALFAVTVIGLRVNGRARVDPDVQQRSSRLRRARYRSAYPAHQQQQQNQRGNPGAPTGK